MLFYFTLWNELLRVDLDFVTYFTISLNILLFCIYLSMFKRINFSLAPAFVFMVFWTLALYFNRFQYSSLQYTWKESTQLYIFSIPLCVFFISYIFFHKVKIRSEYNVYLGRNRFLVFSILFIGIGYITLIYQFSKVGIIPIIASNINEGRIDYSLPMLNVVSEAFLKLGAIISGFLFYAGFRKISIILIAISFLYFLLIFSRSGILELILYYLYLYLTVYDKGFFYFPTKFIGVCVVGILLFSVLGQLRQGDDFDINKYSEMDVNNNVLGWLYSYVPINLDNLAIEIEKGTPSYTPSNTLRSPIEVFQLDDDLLWFDLSYEYIGKLNLGTGVKDFILDWGPLGALVSICILFIMINSMYCRAYKTGIAYVARSYILTSTSLLLLTNRFLQTGPIFIFVALILIDLYVSNRRVEYR